MTGDKTIGKNYLPPPKDKTVLVHKTVISTSTDSSGKTTFKNLEWDTYNIDIASGEGKQIAASCPQLPFLLLPNKNVTLDLALTPIGTNSLTVVVKNNLGNLVEDATVKASGSGFEKQNKQTFAARYSFRVSRVEIIQ